MRLNIHHRTHYRYDPAVAAVAIRLKLYPSRFTGQRPLGWRVTVNGEPAAPDFRNGWGDEVATRFVRGAVTEVEVVAAGQVETADQAGLLAGFEEWMRPGVCLRSTPRTTADAAIRALGAEAAAPGGTRLAQAHRLQDLVSARIAYRAGATDAGTAAADALAAGAGVCQDHSHVLIAAARSLGWPARYVAGYYLPGADGDGDVATHAWAEIWIDDLGWVGFDTSNDLCPTDAYVRVCAGLDAGDGAPLRGHVQGGSTETLAVDVVVRPERGAEQ